MKVTRSLPFLLVLVFSGCLVGPDFEPQQPEFPAQFDAEGLAKVNPLSKVDTTASEDAQWWKQFHDETLVSLIERADLGNLDVKIAEARIQEARANVDIAVAGLLPKINVTGLARNNRNTTVVVGGGSGSSAPSVSSGSGGSSSHLFQSGFDASWELDLFGGARRQREAAMADLLSSEESAHAVMLSLRAEIASNYLTLRGTQERLDVANRTLIALTRAAELVRKKFDAGFVSRLDLANAEAEAATARSRIPPLQAQEEKLTYALSVLLGKEPASLQAELSPHGNIPPSPPTVPVGLPSELARRRPDIRQAEADLHAATARIGVAISNLFPSLSLTGSGGYRGQKLSDIGDWAKRFWSFGANVNLPIFDGGQLVGTVFLSDAREQQAFFSYQKTVLTALKEVEGALTDFSLEQSRLEALKESRAQSALALDIALKQYQDGNTDYLNVITAQRTLYTAEDTLTQSRQTVGTSLIALYKALGGGWESTEVKNPPQ